MPVSNPCSVMIGRVLNKDLGGEEGDGVSVHWYTPKRSKNPCRRSVYGRGSWSTDFVYDSNNKRVADSGIKSASVACTGPVNLKVVPNESCLGRSLWTD